MLKLVLGTRDWSNAPPPPTPPPPKDGRFRKRRQVLRQLPVVCVEGDSSGQPQHIFPKYEPWISDESYGMPLGERGDQKYEDLSLSPLFKSNCWEKWRTEQTKSIPLWRRHSVIPEGEAEKNHPRRDINGCHYLQSQLNPTYVFFPPDTEGVEGQPPHLFSLSRHKERLELMRKRENGTKILISLK